MRGQGKRRVVDYEVWKDGGVVHARFNALESFAPTQASEPLGKHRIFAVDTESLTLAGELKTLLIPVHFHDGSHVLETPDGAGCLEKLFDLVYTRSEYVYDEDRPSRGKFRTGGRKKDERTGKLTGPKTSRGVGRRETTPPCLSVWFNLPYDIGRLLSGEPTRHALRAAGSGAEGYVLRVGKYQLEVARMHFGSSSSFEWFIRLGKKVVRMLGMDLTGYWKSSLAAAAKAAGVSSKIDIEDAIEGVYEKPRESFTLEEWELFRQYAAGDVLSTWELYLRTVELLAGVDARVVRQTGLIPPSAPGASARVLFAKAFDCHPNRTAWTRYPAWADQFGLDAYFGGRAFCTTPGTHRRMGTLDLKSAYPFQMALLPDPVTVEMIPAPEKRYARDAAGQAAFVAEWRGKYGVLYVSGEALDPIMPAFRMHDEARGGRLRYVFGRFEHAAVTIPELVIGVLRGALRIDRVGKPPTRGMPGFWMRGNAETSFLREGIRAFFSIKEDAQNEQALRDMAKLLMNSAYGKFIEIKRGEYLVSELFPMPRFQKKRAVCGTIARLFASSGALAPGMYFGEEGAEEDKAREIYAANVRADSSPAEAVVAYVEALDAAGVARTGSESIKVRDYVRGEKRYDCGHYFLPAYASQITGATSAMVGLMAHVVGALQGDTDSVHVPIPTGMRKIGEVKAKERYFEIMAAAGYPSPRVVVSAEGKHELVGGVPGLGKIGIWEEECPDPSEESILVRPKLYSHKFVAEHQFKDQKSGEPICKTCKLTFHESVELNGDDFCTIYKQAKHGFAKFHDPLVEEIQRSRGARDSRGRKMAHARKIRLHEAMRNLLTTGSHEYRTRSAPRRLRAAIAHGLTVGEFTSEPMKMILTPDPNTERGEGGETRWKRL